MSAPHTAQVPVRGLSRRLRIRTRLGLAFGLLLLLLLGLAALSVVRLTGWSEALNRIVDEQSAVRDSVNEINRNAEAVARKLLVLMSPDAELRVGAYPEIASANARLDDAMQRLSLLLPAGPRSERLADVRQRLADYRASYVDVRDLIERDDFQAARALLGSDTESTLSLFVGAIRQLAASEERAGMARARELRDQIDADRTGVLALCIGALVAGALLAVGATRSIVNPLKRAEAGAELIAQGQYGHRIEVDSADEVGHMATAMNTMAVAVGEREAELRRLADIDMLTGLPQRARFIADGDRLLAGLPEGERFAVLICIDVDRLKAVNSVLGFDAGDALLQGAAAKLAALFEGVAAHGRLAGGTFAALAPVSRLEHGAALAAQLRDLIDQATDKARERLHEAKLGDDLSPEEFEAIAHKVAIAALKFADLSNARTTSYVFDLDRFMSFEGKTGPYLLYQSVRIKSLLRKGAEQGLTPGAIVIAEPAERDLALTLDAFSTAVSDAYDKRMPHLVAEHAYSVAQSFSKFYAACPVLIAPDEATKRSRLALSAAALRQLEIALNLLGIDTPERM